ncbi:MAG: flagellar hook-length control protein FliK [Nitrospirae bacterium]|nr:flagellar hook-length control protein FliK [Nitrospirota bacterium]
MINNIVTGDVRNLLFPGSPAGGASGLKAGTIIKAEVSDITGKGEALLRVITAGTGKEAMTGTVIKAFTDVPLTRGQTVYLEVLGGRDNIRMQLIENADGQAASSLQKIPAKILDMLASLSSSRSGSAELKDLLSLLRTLPESIKAAVPEFEGLENLLRAPAQLNGKVIRAFVETSGVAFETRLKIAILHDPESMLKNLIAMQAEGDLKGLLLRLKSLLKEPEVLRSLKQAGLDLPELSAAVEKFTRNIEFFQMTSKLNDMFCTFIPLLWDGLKDSEFLFRKNKNEKNACYTCDINLDLERLGRMSASVTVMDRAFYVSFFVERQDVADLISSGKKLLQERFAAQGLALKAVNVSQKQEITFGKPRQQGLDLKA